MTPLDGAIEMAALGFPVFPVKPGTKGGKGEHLTASWKAAATVDQGRILSYAARFPNCNWAMRCTGHLVLDVDTADGKAGDAAFLALDLAHDLPPTRTHRSARGGSHVLLSLPPGVEVSNRDTPLGGGINVRGAGGYIMCPGSTFAGRPYSVADRSPIAPAPASLVDLLKAPAAVKGAPSPEEHEDHPSAIATAVDWLQGRPPAVKGERGSQVYKAAARLRDWGITRETALSLIADHFGARMDPPQNEAECRHETHSAYKNAQNTAGAKSIAAHFDDMTDLVAELEREVEAHGAAPITRGVQLVWPVSRESDEIDPKTGNPKRIVDKHAIDNIRAHLAWTGTVLWYDEFANEPRIKSTYFKLDGPLTDADLNNIRLDAHDRGLRAPKDHYIDVAMNAAHNAKRHPVREYLDGLKWDGVPRVADLFTKYAGSPDAALTRAAATLLLVAAVRRVRKPGAKFDYLPVLEGPQGGGKTSLVSILAGEWGGESLSLAATDKEIIEQTSGVWIAEVAELSGMSRAESSHIKAALTRKKDKARAAYARLSQTVLRQFIAVATTNDTRYLTDPTGNRRYLPIRVEGVRFADLIRDRDQLFAEASVLERAYGPLVLPKPVQAELEAAQQSREVVDPVREVLEPLYGPGGPGWVPCEQIWRQLGYDGGRQPARSDAVRASAVMGALGFEHRRAPRSVAGGGQPWVWVRMAAGSAVFPVQLGSPTPPNRRGIHLAVDNDAERAAAELLA